MNLYDNEAEIIRDFQLVPTDCICIIPNGEAESSDVVLSVLDEDRWKQWVDSSGKGDPPPDFYSDTYGSMMDVMRVDDHGFISKKGKVVNPTLAKEHEIIKDFERKGLFVTNPDVRLQVLASTDLPTDEDHNYSFYRDSFRRTIASHIKKIKRYKENHPGYKVIFFVLDESSAYFELDSCTRRISEGEAFSGYPHLWYEDKEFIEAFANTEIDYLIWYTPYKHCTAFSEDDGNCLILPQVVVFNVKNIGIPVRQYVSELMESAEC